MNIGNLYLGIKLDTKELKTGLSAAHAKVNTFATGASKKFSSFTSSVFSAKGAILSLAGSAGLGALVKSSLNAADKIGKVSDAIGITTSTLQEYRYAADLSGVSTQSLDKSIMGFSKRMGEAKAGTGSLSEYLKKTNSALLEQVAAASSTDAALKLIFDAMGNTADASDRAALAAAAFGRSGSRWRSWLKKARIFSSRTPSRVKILLVLF